MAWNESHRRVRQHAASWEFATFGQFKAALAAESEVLTRTNAQKLVQLPAGLPTLEQLAYRFMAQLSSSGGGNQAVNYSVTGDVEVAYETLRQLVDVADKVGYYTAAQLRQFKRMEQQLRTNAASANNSPELRTVVLSLGYKALSQYMDNQEAQLALFEAALKKSLPAGVTLQPEASKPQSTAASGRLLQINMIPKAADRAQMQISARELPKVGTKYVKTQFTLGQTLQGIDQKVFFGTLRYFWYNSSIQNEVRALLVHRMLKAFPNADDPVVFRVGNTMQTVTPNLLLNRIEGLKGQGQPGASKKQLQRAHLDNASQQDIAIRTWIESKNVPAAQGIIGNLRFGFMN